MAINYNINYVLNLLCIYVLLMATTKVLKFDIYVSVIIYIFASMIIVLNSIFMLSKYKYLDKTMLLLFLVMIFLIVVNILINQMGTIEAIKILGTQMFFFIGSTTLIQNELPPTRTVTKYQLFILIGVPIAVVVLQMLHFIEVQSTTRELSSIFINKNNAVVYFIVLAPYLYFLNLKNKFILLYLIVAVFLFKTLGAFVALFMASVMIYFRPTLKSLIYSIFMIFVLSIVLFLAAKSELPIVERFINVYTVTNELFDYYSYAEITQLSFGEVVELTGSTDLSSFFRVIHWIDIFTYYCNAPFYNELFGIGLDNIKNIAHINVPAHNDWLRMLVEIGLFYFILFLIFILLVLKQIAKRDRIVTLFFLTVLIYFTSENLIDNFPAMSFFYYFLGLNYTNSKKRIRL